jgi:hypothetical protein
LFPADSGFFPVVLQNGSSLFAAPVFQGPGQQFSAVRPF